ncbi:MAG: DUF4124 domain-containing protein [Desulfuromonadaceae bacterium]
MIKPFVILASVFILLNPCIYIQSHADSYYTWRDADGHLHITNRPTGSIQDKDGLQVYHFSQEKTEHRGTSDPYQRRVYQQLDSADKSVSYNATKAEHQRQSQLEERFEKTVEVEEDILNERIHYYKFRCANVRSSPGRKSSCDASQKLYEKKLDLLRRDPEKYFIRELR